MTNTVATGVAYADPALIGFTVGTAANPIAQTSAANTTSSYVTTSATTGDTRLSYNKLTFSSTGSGETIRAFTVATGANAGTGGTLNGIHASLEMQGGSISGAGSAIRATLGGTTATQTGTLAAIQLDTNFSTDVSSLPSNASFIRVTNSGAATTKIANLFNLPAAMVVSGAAADSTHKIKIVSDAGVAYYLMATTVAP